VPFIAAPCFPGYGSAHAAAGYAARRIAERILGAGPHSITLSSPAVPGVTLHYTSFEEITDDIDDARVYGGIHFRFDQQAGARQGRRIGTYIHQHNLLRQLSSRVRTSARESDVAHPRLESRIGRDRLERRVLRHLREFDGPVLIGALERRERRLFLTERIVDQREAEP
jgi:hypothetical protein